MTFGELKIRKALRKAWSLETAVQWTSGNPASGQCNVTAAVIHDLFDGDILRTRIGGVWHYYNRMDGIRYDLTDSQFAAPDARVEAPTPYEDELSSISDAMRGIPLREYDCLKQALLSELARRATDCVHS